VGQTKKCLWKTVTVSVGTGLISVTAEFGNIKLLVSLFLEQLQEVA